MDSTRVYEVLKRIDPEVRRHSLEDGIKILERRFVDQYHQVEVQRRLLNHYEAEYAAWKQQTNNTGLIDPERDAHIHGVRRELVRQEVVLETIAETLENDKAALEAMTTADLPKV